MTRLDSVLRRPAAAANVARNARAERDRRKRWAPARDALWAMLDDVVAPGARIAVVGAGNGDDLPIARLAERAGALVLLDVDPHAPRAARRHAPRAVRDRIELLECDVTGGAADAIAAAARRGGELDAEPAEHALPGAPYDVVVGDLFYTQLLNPALVDLGLAPVRRDGLLARHQAALTRAAVRRLHASAPAGTVVHVHDPLAWWPGHPQPVALETVLAAARTDVAAALALVAGGDGPRSSDPRPAVVALGRAIAATRIWHWPFAPGVDYLVVATVA